MLYTCHTSMMLLIWHAHTRSADTDSMDRHMDAFLSAGRVRSYTGSAGAASHTSRMPSSEVVSTWSAWGAMAVRRFLCTRCRGVHAPLRGLNRTSLPSSPPTHMVPSLTASMHVTRLMSHGRWFMSRLVRASTTNSVRGAAIHMLCVSLWYMAALIRAVSSRSRFLNLYCMRTLLPWRLQKKYMCLHLDSCPSTLKLDWQSRYRVSSDQTCTIPFVG
mmetsp:Transcript_272/g.587  ORF Transcript_272/g.587 Transcript_272/m.587 type:complete len:217 (-) Transcript_272:693-1343(-)